MYVNCACMNSEKRYFSSPFSGEHFRVREIFLVSILSVWGENLTLLKVSFWLQIWSLAYIFFCICVFFYLFCFVHSVNFCCCFVLVQPAMEGVEVRIFQWRRQEVACFLFLVSLSFHFFPLPLVFSAMVSLAVFCYVPDGVHCAFECSAVICPMFVCDGVVQVTLAVICEGFFEHVLLFFPH